MRSPSSRVLINRCDVYSGTEAQSAGGGVRYTYPAVPTVANEPCSAQPKTTTETITEQDRLIRQTDWFVMFGRHMPVKNRDKLVITDSAGHQHEAYVHIQQNQAGRNAAFVVYATEKV